MNELIHCHVVDIHQLDSNCLMSLGNLFVNYFSMNWMELVYETEASTYIKCNEKQTSAQVLS